MKGKLYKRKRNSLLYWVVVDEKTYDEYRLTDNSLSTPSGFTRNLIEGEQVNYKLIVNYGFDPYDNQFPGIDYYDACEITKHITNKDWRKNDEYV